MKAKNCEPLTERIRNANGEELNEIINAVIRRYGELFPEWEMHFVSMHRDGEKRKADIQKLFHFLEAVEEWRRNEGSTGWLKMDSQREE